MVDKAMLLGRNAKIILAILLFSFTSEKVMGQSYFLIDDKSSEYKTSKIVLDAQELYGLNEQITMYNLLLDKQLILFYNSPSNTPHQEINISTCRDKKM